VFLALTAVGVAGRSRIGQTSSRRCSTPRGTAGLVGADLEEIKEAARSGKGNFSEVTKLPLTPEERLFAYAIAAWLVRIDGMVMPEEKMALARLGDALCLRRRRSAPARPRLVQDSRSSTDAPPPGFDCLALAEAIRSALAESMRPPEGAGS